MGVGAFDTESYIVDAGYQQPMARIGPRRHVRHGRAGSHGAIGIPDAPYPMPGDRGPVLLARR